MTLCHRDCQHQRREQCEAAGAVAAGVVYDRTVAADSPSGWAVVLLPRKGQRKATARKAEQEIAAQIEVDSFATERPEPPCATCGRKG